MYLKQELNVYIMDLPQRIALDTLIFLLPPIAQGGAVFVISVTFL